LKNDREAVVEKVRGLLSSVAEATRDYHHSNSLIHLSDQCPGANGTYFSWSVEIGVREICLLASLVQCPIGLRGGTDKGKTFLAERVLSGLFGTNADGWWRLEINRGIQIEDLIDIDLKKLSETKLSEAMSGASWLSYPGRLIDESNRAHPKMVNCLIHLLDASGLNVRGDLHLPVGLPYKVNGATKRYSFTVVTANNPSGDYEGVFEEDAAVRRRIVLSLNLDDLPPAPRDSSQMISRERPKTQIPEMAARTGDVIAVYEALPSAIEYSALGFLFLHYLVGCNTCIRTRSGQFNPNIKSQLCPKCHLYKSHRYCGRVSGVSEGLLLWVKEVAQAIAALRAAKVVDQIEEKCGDTIEAGRLQQFVGSVEKERSLFEAARKRYLDNLRVTGEDIVAAYTLVAPGHVWIDESWLNANQVYEGQAIHALAEQVKSGWDSMRKHLREKQSLFKEIIENAEISPLHQDQVERLITTEDPAMLAVISALRDRDLPLRYRENLATPQATSN
jgi:hypothetical protein